MVNDESHKVTSYLYQVRYNSEFFSKSRCESSRFTILSIGITRSTKETRQRRVNKVIDLTTNIEQIKGKSSHKYGVNKGNSPRFDYIS